MKVKVHKADTKDIIFWMSAHVCTNFETKGHFFLFVCLCPVNFLTFKHFRLTRQSESHNWNFDYFEKILYFKHIVLQKIRVLPQKIILKFKIVVPFSFNYRMTGMIQRRCSPGWIHIVIWPLTLEMLIMSTVIKWASHMTKSERTDLFYRTPVTIRFSVKRQRQFVSASKGNKCLVR